MLISELSTIKMSVQTAVLLQTALAGLIEREASSRCEVAHLRLFREGDQMAIADGHTALFVSLAGARNIIAELPRYIAIASSLSCAQLVPSASRRLPRTPKITRPGAAKPN